jgi:hypothetical protein
VGLAAVSMIVAGCGSVAAAGGGGEPAVHARRATLVRSAGPVTVGFGGGAQTRSFRMRRPAGIVLLYRIGAPAGVRIRGTALLPHVSAPLMIRTVPFSASSTCAHRAARVSCTVGEEACPMPSGTWVITLEKLSGPAGAVTLRFRVGPPPGSRRT